MKNKGGLILGLFLAAGILLYIYNSAKNPTEEQISAAVDDDTEESSELPDSERIELLEGRVDNIERQIDNLFCILDVNSNSIAKRFRIEVLTDRRHILFARIYNAQYSVRGTPEINDWENQMKRIDQELDRLTSDANK
jgi:hypothetical protein